MGLCDCLASPIFSLTATGIPVSTSVILSGKLLIAFISLDTTFCWKWSLAGALSKSTSSLLSLGRLLVGDNSLCGNSSLDEPVNFCAVLFKRNVSSAFGDEEICFDGDSGLRRLGVNKFWDKGSRSNWLFLISPPPTFPLFSLLRRALSEPSRPPS